MPRKVNPNRMELLKLKKRFRLARRGHKLMKDKFDALLKEFLELANTAYSLREKFESSLERDYQFFVNVIAEHDLGLVESVFKNLPIAAFVEITPRKQVGVSLVSMTGAIGGDAYLFNLSDFSPMIVDVIERSHKAFNELVKLAETEHNVKLLAAEMERTRRRVNALEQVLIPQLEAQIKAVSMKLEEMDRESRTRVMKVKEMLEAQRAF